MAADRESWRQKPRPTLRRRSLASQYIGVPRQPAIVSLTLPDGIGSTAHDPRHVDTTGGAAVFAWPASDEAGRGHDRPGSPGERTSRSNATAIGPSATGTR